MNEEKPTLIDDQELVFHKRLVEKINQASAQEQSIRGQLQRAQEIVSQYNSAMQEWVEHLGDKYGLKPNDVVDLNGTIHYLDFHWSLEAMKKLRDAPPTESMQDEPIQQAVPIPKDSPLRKDEPTEEFHFDDLWPSKPENKKFKKTISI